MAVDTVLPSVFEADLPVLSYDHTESPAQVYPRLRAAQQQSPIAIGPIGPEVLSYELARAVLRDTRFTIPPGLHLMAQGVSSGPLWDKVVGSLLCLEGAAHQRLRRLVSKAFTPRATARLQDTIATVFNELIDRVADSGRCEVVTDLARPYPVPIICALLGAPQQDWQLFSRWTDEVFKAFGFNPDLTAEQPAIMAAWGELDDYVDEMVARRRGALSEDLLSDLIRAEDDGDRLDAAELRMLAASLLMAGTDTTRNQLAASVDVLCDHPEQWDTLRHHPELAINAVDESMRHSPAVCGAPRTVTRDVEIGGFVFPAGTFVYVNTFAANRDPEIYRDADRFDIARDSPPPILTFGGGMHYCLGANLARRELADALQILTQRIAAPRRTGPAPWKPILGMSGPTSLPLEFTPGA